jgi:ubiquinone/menaquinone biosynthesis C-methylase UbiE
MSETFKNFEQKAWERKATLYDGTWGSVTSQVIDAVLCVAKIQEGDRLLDIGCGPGHLCKAAENYGALAIGCDYSRAMIEIASAQYSEIVFEVQDAEHLRYEDNTFDICTLNYLLLHVSDQEAALQEAARVLRPGGRLVYSMWLPPSESPGLHLIFSALRAFADMTVIPPAQDIFLFSDTNFATQFFMKNGFTDVSKKSFPSCWNVTTSDSFFAGVQAGSRIGGLLELQSDDCKIKIREHIESGLEEFRSGSAYRIPMPSVLVSARKAEISERQPTFS